MLRMTSPVSPYSDTRVCIRIVTVTRKVGTFCDDEYYYFSNDNYLIDLKQVTGWMIHVIHIQLIDLSCMATQ